MEISEKKLKIQLANFIHVPGMLRSGPKIKNQPLLIAPCGYKYNSLFASANFKSFKENSTIQNLISSGDMFLQRSTKPVSVMQIEPRVGQDSMDSGSAKYSTVYSCVGLSMGPVRDAADEKELSKFWYLGRQLQINLNLGTL